jgi:hypothetical protein
MRDLEVQYMLKVTEAREAKMNIIYVKVSMKERRSC